MFREIAHEVKSALQVFSRQTRILIFPVLLVVSCSAQRPDIAWMRGGHSGGIYQLGYSPDGQTLVSVGETVKIWRASDGMLLRTIRSPFTQLFPPGNTAISNDAQFVVATGPTPSGGTTQLVRTDDAGAPPVWSIPLAVTGGLSFSPDGSQIAAGTADGIVHILNAADGTQKSQIPQSPTYLQSFAAPSFSPDGNSLAICTSQSGYLTISPVPGDGTYRSFGELTCGSGYLFWSRDGQFIATRSALWAVSTACPGLPPGCQPSPALNFPSTAYSAYTAFTSTGDLAHGESETVSPDPVLLYHPTATSPYTTIEAGNPQDPSGTTYLGYLTYTPDNSTLALALSTQIQLWNPQDGAVAFERNITVDWGLVEGVAFSPDGTLAVTGSASFSATDGVVNVYDIATGNLVQSLVAYNGSGQAPGVYSVHFTPDGQSLVVDVGETQTNVYQIGNPAPQQTFAGIGCADLSPDGKYLSSGASLYLFADGSKVGQGTGYVLSNCSRFSPDGQYLAVIGNAAVYVYRVQDMTLAGTPPKYTLTISAGNANAFAWSADSTMVAAGGYNSGNPPPVYVWKIDGSYSTTLAGSTGQIRTMGFSLDGGYLTAGGDDGVLRIWQISDGSVVQSYDQETGGSPAGSAGYNLFSLTYSPDGSTILYGRADASVVAAVNPFWLPPVSSVTAPTPVVGGAKVKGTVTLAAAAPSSTVVTLTSSHAKVAAVQAQVTVPAGKTSVQFTIVGGTVGVPTAAVITAAANGRSASASVTVNPAGGLWLTGVSASPASVTGGASTTGTVTLNTAPAADVTVTLASLNAAASVPASVTVGAGTTSATFPISTTAVSVKTTVPIHATYNGGTVAGGLVVKPPALASLALHPTTVTGGITTTNNTVRLNGVAPVGGIVVGLSSNNASVAAVPATVTVPEGDASATFSITTTAVTSSTDVTIIAASGSVTKTADLTVRP
ncbi:MAG: hypothetical protein ABSG56_29075 [Bryobacteraceae bacterium]|jgi:WD40 repeat protein